MRILLADDHPLFLDGLKNLLKIRGIDVVGTAIDGLEALEKARALKPDVILMDIRMPQLNGLAATRLIKAEQPDIKIVMLTYSENDDRDAHLLRKRRGSIRGDQKRGMRLSAQGRRNRQVL